MFENFVKSADKSTFKYMHRMSYWMLYLILLRPSDWVPFAYRLYVTQFYNSYGSLDFELDVMFDHATYVRRFISSMNFSLVTKDPSPKIYWF